MEDQAIVTPREGDGITLTTAAPALSGPVASGEPVMIFSIPEGARARLLAGTASRPPDERVIRARSNTELTITTSGGDVAADPRDRVIISRDDEWLRPSPMAG